MAGVLHFVSFVFAALILAFVLWQAGPTEVWRSLRTIDPYTALAVTLLNLPLLLLWTLRSLLVLRHMGHTMPIRVLLPATILGNVAGALTPAASGELLRASALQRSGGVTMAEGLTLVAYERLLSTYLLLLSTSACVGLTVLTAMWGWLVAVAAVLLVLAPWLAAMRLPRLTEPQQISGGNAMARFVRYLLRMTIQVRVLMTDPRLLVSCACITLLSFGLIALQFHLVARSLSVHLSVADAWIAFGGSGLAGIISLIPLGLGVGDGSMAAIIHRTGITLERATAVTVLVRATVTLPLIVLAVAAYFYLLRVTAAAHRIGVEDNSDF